jgi:hypothetical protein
LTNGGRGVGFFTRLRTRVIFIVRPIEVSPISVTRFFDQAARILHSERFGSV